MWVILEFCLWTYGTSPSPNFGIEMGAGKAGKSFSKEVISKQRIERFIEINQVTSMVG